VLRYYAGLPDTQIAAALGTSARGDMPHRMRPVFPPDWTARNRSRRSPFVGGTLVAAGKDARDEHGQEAGPVVVRGQAVDRECAARTRTRYRPSPGNGTRRMKIKREAPAKGNPENGPPPR
jgi:hypothetical protein